MMKILQLLLCIAVANAFNDRLSNSETIQYQQRSDRERATYARLRAQSKQQMSDIINAAKLGQSKPGVTPTTEITALKDFYSSTRGSSWIKNAGWNTGDPCNDLWYGVKCNNNHVVALLLVYNNLDGDISDRFCDLTELTIFQFYENKVSGFPSCINQMSKLELIDGSGNSLRALPQMDNMAALSTLTLYQNVMTGSLPSLNGCSNLTSLSLSSNKFTGPVPRDWGSLIKLKELVVSRNPGITGSYPSEWGNLSNLQQLWTFMTTLRGSLPDSWKGMTSLQNIEMDDVSGVIPTWINAWSYMNTFILTGRGNGALTGNLPSGICNMKHLSVVWFFGNKLDGTFPSCMGVMSEITNLQLQDQKFSSSIPSQFNMPKLKYLYMSNNGFTGSIPSGFGKSSNLSVLDLHENLLTGTLPNDLSVLRALIDLSVDSNRLVGPIPSSLENWLVNHMSVWTCRLDNNPFKCPLPTWLPADCLATCVNATQIRSSKQAWSQFKERFGKTYGSMMEENSRFRIFETNLDRVKQLNQQNGEIAFGVTKFSDLSPAEFKLQYLSGYAPSLNLPRKGVSQPGRKLMSNLPEKMDWRDHGAVTVVKDQGQCGSCWAFSATEAVESGYFMMKQTLPILSPQQIVSCDTKGGDYGCNGGFPYGAYEYLIKAGGIETEQDYPYTSGGGESGTCRFDASKVSVQIRNYTYALPPCEEGACDHQDEMLFAANVVTFGPASVCVDATTWQFYHEGIVRELEACPRDAASQDHCVELVGFNTDEGGKKYWIVRNSWGLSWGMKGYILLEIGQNLCGIANLATFVDV